MTTRTSMKAIEYFLSACQTKFTANTEFSCLIMFKQNFNLSSLSQFGLDLLSNYFQSTVIVGLY